MKIRRDVDGEVQSVPRIPRTWTRNPTRSIVNDSILDSLMAHVKLSTSLNCCRLNTPMKEDFFPNKDFTSTTKIISTTSMVYLLERMCHLGQSEEFLSLPFSWSSFNSSISFQEQWPCNTPELYRMNCHYFNLVIYQPHGDDASIHVALCWLNESQDHRPGHPEELHSSLSSEAPETLTLSSVRTEIFREGS